MMSTALANRQGSARVERLNPNGTARGRGPVRLRTVLPAVLVALIGFLGVGCGKTVVQPGAQFSGAALAQRPERILVYDFAVTTAEVKENQGMFQSKINEVQGITTREHEQEIAAEVRKVAAEELVEGIRKMGLPAERAAADMLMTPRSLGIVGQFVDVDEGNKAARMVIGFGQGQSRVDIRVQVFGHGLTRDEAKEAAPIKLLAFETHADSGTMPGALVTAGAGAAAQGGVTAGMAAANVGVGAVKSYRSAMGQMTSRSAEQAVAYLSEFFFIQGWIAPDKVIRAERK